MSKITINGHDVDLENVPMWVCTPVYFEQELYRIDDCIDMLEWYRDNTNINYDTLNALQDNINDLSFWRVEVVRKLCSFINQGRVDVRIVQ